MHKTKLMLLRLFVLYAYYLLFVLYAYNFMGIFKNVLIQPLIFA